MSAYFVAVSDLHLGYDRSVFLDPGTQDRVVEEIADLCGGSTRRLILNGDCFEATVPSRVGEYDLAGFPPVMAEVSRSFFSKFTSKIACESLVILWGNHDFCLWQRLAAACGAPTFTNDLAGDVLLKTGGHVRQGAESFLADVVGPASEKFQRVRSAYPNYVLGHYWPYVVFHHGHLLDKLVLGWESSVDYWALKLLVGRGSSEVYSGEDDTLAAIHRQTQDFIGALWKYNSRSRAEEWLFLRRLQHRHTCPSYPAAPDKQPTAVVEWEPQGKELGEQAKWYLDVVASDPTTPAFLGPSDKPGTFFIGHDHDGGVAEVPGLDGHDWKLVNLGGWTTDRDESAPHSHVVVWDEGADEPTVYCVRTRQ